MIPPRRIALSGGGMMGIAHVGVLEVLQARGLLKHVKEYLGTSAGALISFCVTIGYTLSELRTLCSVLDFSQVQNLDVDTMLQFPDILGLDDGKNVDRFLNVLIRAKGFKETTTFEEFYLKKPDAPNLRIFATNMDTLALEEFSRATPRVPLTFAVRASMTIPFLFTPVRHCETGQLLVDGGIISNFPFHHLRDSEREETIGVSFNIHSNGAPIEKYSLIQLFLHCFLSTYKTNDRELYSKWGHKIIDITCDIFVALQFNASQEQKLEIINGGVKDAETFFKKQFKKPARRYSLP
jgi:NTE family protein